MLPAFAPQVDSETAAPPALPAEAPTYYRIQSGRLSFTEYWRLIRSWKVIFPWIGKLLGRSQALVTGLPAPSPLRDNLVSCEELHPESQTRLDEMREACEALGFAEPLYFGIKNSLLRTTEPVGCILRHPADGESLAVLTYTRLLAAAKPGTSTLAFVSQLADGRQLATSNFRLLFDQPPGDDVIRLPGAAADALYREHCRRLAAHRLGANPPLPARTFEEISALIWRDASRGHDFNVARGLYVPMTPAEVERACARKLASDRLAAEHPPKVVREVNAVLAALERRENSGASSRTAALAGLVLSLTAFALLALLRWDWTFVALIVGTLFFHESGHYLAMRAFGYPNLRMYFVPFFGAAVTGMPRHAPGWQKALVLLAGPLPGIILGACLLVGKSLPGGHLRVEAGMMLLAINAFNLLPLLPLDGGRLLYETLFCRHPLLRAGFSALAAAGLMALGWQLSSPVLGVLGFFALMAVGRIWRVSRASSRMRAEGVKLTDPAPGPGQEEPVRVESLPALLDALKMGRQQVQRPAILAAEAVEVIDQARARPPRLAAALGLLALYAAACALAFSFLAPVLSPYAHGSSARRRAEAARQIEAARERARATRQQHAEDSPAPDEESADEDE